MQASINNENNLSVLTLSGEVDLAESPKARQHIIECLGGGSHLLVDLSAVVYIDSSGIASLVEGLQLARDKNLKFGLVNVSRAATQVLKLARLDRVFPIYETVDDFRNVAGE